MNTEQSAQLGKWRIALAIIFAAQSLESRPQRQPEEGETFP